jgi:hypothetical protein
MLVLLSSSVFLLLSASVSRFGPRDQEEGAPAGAMDLSRVKTLDPFCWQP